MSKSHVTLETAVCPVCGREEETGALLLDTRVARDPRTGRTKLRETFEHRTATGWNLCADHRALFADGYVALVGASNHPAGGAMKPDEAIRTGEVMHITLRAADHIFGGGWPKRPDGTPQPLAFCEPALIERVRKWAEAQGVAPIDPKDRPQAEGRA